MGWNGSGTFDRLYNWVNDKIAGIKILSAKMDDEFGNYKSGLENCLTRDGQTRPTANINWNAKKILNLADATLATDAVNIQTMQRAAVNYAVATGSAGNYSVTLSPAPSTLASGLVVWFQANHDTTGVSTLNVNGLGVKTIKIEGRDTIAGDIKSGSIYQCSYNTATGFMDLQKTYLAPASETVVGVSELATSAETITGTDNTRATHPSGVAAAIANKAVLFGGIRGLICTHATDTEHDITCGAGICVSSDFTTIGIRSAAITKQMDNTWAEGNNLGGMAAGVSLPTSGTIHIHELIKPDGTTEVIGDTSITCVNGLATAAVISAGYTKYRRIKSYLTDASANIRNEVSVEQAGGSLKCYYSTPITVWSNSSALNNLLVMCPAGGYYESRFQYYAYQGINGEILVTQGIGGEISVGESQNDNDRTVAELVTNTSGQLNFRLQGTNESVTIKSLSYTDPRSI